MWLADRLISLEYREAASDGFPSLNASRISREGECPNALRHMRRCPIAMLAQYLVCAGPELPIAQH